MAKIIKGAVVISDEELESLLKVDKVIDKFIEFYDLMKSLTEKEQKMLIKSLEMTDEEMKDNG
ncbi:MAG: hypothetical protein HDT42_09010 [Ruminococcaceae bacterium]|nr:hypothetical protein [Oscillospiraceae bacterium]